MSDNYFSLNPSDYLTSYDDSFEQHYRMSKFACTGKNKRRKLKKVKKDKKRPHTVKSEKQYN